MISTQFSKLRSMTALALLSAFISSQYAQEVTQAPTASEQKPSAAVATNEAGGKDSTTDADEELVVLPDYVVTGTILRGVPPPGTNVVNLKASLVRETAAVSGSEILASVPQVVNYFNNVPSINAGSAQTSQTIKPNLRNLPGGLGSGGTTLVLMNGQRVAGIGVTSFAVDTDIMPIGALENVEISTDGGSAAYGADAVGGVINYIPIQRFDGARVDARYGFADGYYKTDANITIGDDWGKGSAYISLSYSKNDNLLAGDVDYVKRLDYSTNPPTPTERRTFTPNVTIVSGPFFAPVTTYYAMPDLVPGTFNSELLDDGSILPAAERKGLYAGLTQSINEKVKVDVRAFYSGRETYSINGAARASVVTPATNYYRAQNPDYEVAGREGVNHTMLFSFAPALGNETITQTTGYDVWGASAGVDIEIAEDWQLRTLLSYSASESDYHLDEINSSALAAAAAGTTAQTAINPYNIAATENTALYEAIFNQERAGEATDALTNLRVILDGPLFSLPAGKVRLALGAEYLDDAFEQKVDTGPRGVLNGVPFEEYSRDSKSGFGELNVPIVSKDNSVGGVKELTISVAARYDEYSDFGSTFNPKIGITYKPTDWLSFRGNWGTSFNAPTPVDQLGAINNVAERYPLAVIAKPNQPAPPFGSVWTLVTQGSTQGLVPQESESYSFGFDVEVPAVSGLRLSASFYHIFFEGILSRPPAFSATDMIAYYPDSFAWNGDPDYAQELEQFMAASSNSDEILAEVAASGVPIYQIIDFRMNNFGNAKVDGLDFGASYRYKAKFGTIDGSISGNYKLTQDLQPSDLAPFYDDLADGLTKMTMRTTLGTTVSDFRAQVAWNYSGPFALAENPQIYNQDRVASFSTVDLYFSYALKGESFLREDVTLSLNVTNALDNDPSPLRQSNSDGYSNGFTVGRMVMFGVSKRF